jgi:hypothetical protein
MQETTPAKLPVPVAGKQYDFTLRDEMSVAELRKCVQPYASDFQLLAADNQPLSDTLKLSQLKLSQFRMSVG